MLKLEPKISFLPIFGFSYIVFCPRSKLKFLLCSWTFWSTSTLPATFTTISRPRISYSATAVAERMMFTWSTLGWCPNISEMVYTWSTSPMLERRMMGPSSTRPGTRISGRIREGATWKSWLTTWSIGCPVNSLGWTT